jgi:hypothetical protein
VKAIFYCKEIAMHNATLATIYLYSRRLMMMKSYFTIILAVLVPFALHAGWDEEEEARDKFGFNENVVFVDSHSPAPDDDYLNVNNFVHFFDDKYGMYIGGYFQDIGTAVGVRVTDDGGNHWFNTNIWADSIHSYLEDVYFLDRDNVYMKFGVYNDSCPDAKAKFVKLRNDGYFREPEEKMPVGMYSYRANDNMMVVNNDTIYMMYASQIYKTTFGGGYGEEYWEQYIPDITPTALAYISIDKAKFDDTYFLVYLSLSGNFYGFHIARSNDYGETWEVIRFKRFNEDDLFDFEFLDYDTWLISHNDRFKPKPNITILKTTDQCQKYDTLFHHKKYADRIPVLKVVGENHDKYILTATNNCTAVSIDGGKNFEYVVNPADVKKTDVLDGFYKSDNTFFFQSRMSGFLMRYSPTSPVNEEIKSFKAKLYPNPAKENSQAYLSLENDKSRNAICKICDINGKIVMKSQAMAIPAGFHTIDFETTDLIAGVYFVIVESHGKRIATEKLIIE